jgi:hypothetical protein
MRKANSISKGESKWETIVERRIISKDDMRVWTD